MNGIDSIGNNYNIIQFNPCNSKIDTTSYTLRNSVLEFKYYKIKVYGTSKEGNKASFGAKNILKTTGVNIDCVGPGSNTEYNLTNKKGSIQFDEEIFRFEYNINKSRVFFNLKNAAWDIRKLTDKELILETTNSDEQKVRLKFNKL